MNAVADAVIAVVIGRSDNPTIESRSRVANGETVHPLDLSFLHEIVSAASFRRFHAIHPHETDARLIKLGQMKLKINDLVNQQMLASLCAHNS